MLVDIIAVSTSGVHTLDAAMVPIQTYFLSQLFPKTSFSGNLPLYSSGCVGKVGGVNCAAACKNPEQTFSNVYTLANCLAYPFISMLVSAETLTTDGLAIAEAFNVLSYTSNSVDLTAIHEVQGDCFAQWKKVVNYDTSKEYLPVNAQVIFSFCDSGCLEGTASTDIGGIGIYTSSWMQSGIVISAFLLVQCLDSWIYCLSLTGLRCVKRLGLKAAKEEATEFQKNWIDRHLKILLMALVEFQKAQCFFILPVQAAALVAISAPATILAPTTLQQSSNNLLLIQLIGVSGMLPVMCTLFSLHGARQKSWYVLGMSTTAVAISAVTIFRAGALNPAPELTLDTRYSACGNHDPSACCLSKIQSLGKSHVVAFGLAAGAPSIAALSMLELFILILDFPWNPEKPIFVPVRDWLIQYIRKQKLKHAYHPGLSTGELTTPSKLERFQLKLGRDWVEKFVRGVFALFYLVVWLCFLISFLLFMLILSFLASANAIDTHTWTFGQIVAIMVWIAPLCEWVYLEFRGLEEGSKYRIPKPFKVIEEADREVIVQHLERDGSLPKSVAQTLLRKHGCFGGSSSGSTDHNQSANSTGDVALQPMGAAANSNTPPDSHIQSSASQTQPPGSQAQPSGSSTQASCSQTQPRGSQTQHLSQSSEEAVQRKIALAIRKGYSEQATFY